VIVLDASVLIGFIYEQDAHHQAAETLLREAAHETFGVSPLTLAEVLVVPARLGRITAAEKMLDDIGVTEVPFPADAAVVLAQLRVESGLKMPDCCVLLAAHTTGAALATFDGALASVASRRRLRVLTA
jgi:predicted nucleic acid-binding protein